MAVSEKVMTEKKNVTSMIDGLVSKGRQALKEFREFNESRNCK